MGIEDIYSFLIEFQGIKRDELSPTVDLCNDLGIEGDDFFELEEEFEERFAVDMSSYRWYFHHGEEGWSIGALFSQSPYQQVKHIPVTPEILLEAAKTSIWPINYPQHKIRSRAIEIGINYFVLLLLVALVVASLVHNFA